MLAKQSDFDTRYAVSGMRDQLVYVASTADTTIDNTTKTIATKDVTGLVAGDQVIIEGAFTFVNNTAATQALTVSMDFDGLFTANCVTGANAFSATLIHSFWFRAVLDIRATNLCYGQMQIKGYTAAGIAGGGDPTMLATSLDTQTWGTSATDATGTTTCALKVTGAAATAGQTLRLHYFHTKKYTPGSY
jgi:hypothetical protein